jgi:serine protease
VLNIMATPTTYDPFLTMAGLIAVSAAGAELVNMSFHIPVPFLLSFTVVPYDLVTRSVRSIGGTLIFAAAGNEGNDIDAEWDLLLTTIEKTWYTPAENGGVLAVGGLDYNSTLRHSSSNYGREQVDIFAPYIVYSGPSDPLVPDNVARLSFGTSVSAPFAAAVAGLIWAANPDLTADSVETILLDTATVGTNQLRGNGNRIVNARRAVAAVLGDTPPSVEIVRPESGREFVKFSQAIAFSAIADDIEGPVLVQWTSNQDGLIAQGTDFSILDLSYGEHEITVTATDSSGQTSTDSISLRILAEDPTVNILSPTAGEQLIAGPIRFTAITRDNDYASGQVPDNLVQWRYYNAATGDEGLPFDMRGHEVTQTFAPGTHLIHVIASDGFSGSAEQFLSITVAAAIANAPVIHRITPTSGSVFFAERGNNYVEVELEALVTDVEDGELDGPSLVWTTNLASLQPLGEAILGTGRRTRARLYTGDSGILHTVTLTATDSDGNSRTQRVGIWASIFI